MVKDGYYWAGEPEFIGSFPIRQELEILPQSPPVKGWTVKKVVSVNGNKYLRLLAKYLRRVNASSVDDLSQDEIQKLLSKCEQ